MQQVSTLATREAPQPAASADPIWAVLVAAGPAGASREEIADGVYPAGGRPTHWEAVIYERLRLLRRPAMLAGLRLDRLAGARPTRWRIAHLDEPEDVAPAPATAPADTPTPAPRPPAKVGARTPPPVVAPIAPALADAEPAPVPSLVFTGAARAHHDLKRCSCRWPLGEPNSEDFRFCGEPVWAEGKSYCRDHARQARGAAERQGRAV